MELKRVVITGLGALTPIGNTIDEYWNSLKAGVSGAARITKFDCEKFKTQFACELKDFNVEDYMHRREARRLDPFSQYAVVSTTEAMAASAEAITSLVRERAMVAQAAMLSIVRVLVLNVP